MKFIELKMLDTRKRPPPKMDPPFLEWKVGYIVKSRNGYAEWEITDIQNVGGTSDMRYEATVFLRNSDEETRTLRGSTLQSGYVYHGGEPAKVEQEWTPMTMAVEAIRNFYPRKQGRPGTRIMTTTGVAYVVADEYEAVRSAVQS